MAIVSRDFVYPLGGFEEYIYQLSSRLRRAGVDITIFTTTRNTKNPRYHESDYDGVLVKRYPISWNLYGYCYSKGLASAIRQADCDVLHAQGWGNYAIDVAAKQSRCSSKPLIITPHAFFQEPGRVRILKAVYNRLLSTRLMTRAHFIAVTESQGRQLRLRGATKVTIIPEGVEVAEFEISQPRPSYLPGHVKIVLSVGRLARYKGLDHVLRAVRIVERELPSVVVVFAGEDWGIKADLERLSRRFRIAGKVKFLGRVSRDELIALYQACDLYVNASVSEGFGISMIEAMACGKPVISTPTGVAADLADRIPVFDFGDVRQLASNMLRLLQDDGLALSLGQSLKQLVNERFNWKLNLERILDVYNSAVSTAIE